MQLIEKDDDLSQKEKNLFFESQYVCIDTETTGLSYINDRLCTIQLFSEGYGIIIRYNNYSKYENLKELLLSDKVIKIFHNAVFDVSFLMVNLKLDNFGKLVCTKIASKILNGLRHNNSLKCLLNEYLNVEISKNERLSDWSKDLLSDSQKEYAINDVKYLHQLWDVLYVELKERGVEQIAFECFEFVPYYKKLTDKGIENIFAY